MSCEQKKTSIGGQAVIEGVMMRGPKLVSMSVRLADGNIDNETWEVKNAKSWYRSVPIIRGLINFFEMMILGYKCITKSAEKMQIDEEDYKPSRFEQKLESMFGDKLTKVIIGLSSVIGIAIAIILFMWVPAGIVKAISNLVPLDTWAKGLLEGLIKIVIFISYIWSTSFMKDTKVLYQYHGAEHKTIACYEHGEYLTAENVKKYSRFHPRCGTSFLFIMLSVSIFVFSFVSWDSLFVRILLKLILMPVVVGIAYELIKITARHDNIFTKILMAPGLWFQRITTKEPTDKQIEVAISAVKPVIPLDQSEDRW
jgi:uncharacterized protein YqhQ